MFSPLENSRLIPLPKLFHSVYLDFPFQKCVECETEFATANDQSDLFDAHYLAKYVVGTETIFEIALCIPCVANLGSGISEESLARIQEFYESHGRRRRLCADVPEPSDDVPEWNWEAGIRDCIFCGKLRENCHRYELGAICFSNVLLVRDRLQEMTSPFMACDECRETLNSILSKQTRDHFDRFFDRHLNGPPGLEVDRPQFRPMIF